MSAPGELVPRDGSVVMFMIVRTPAGRPIGYPMTGLLDDGELRITTYRKSAKARYLLADDRVCCVVPSDAVDGRGTALYGRAVPVTGEQRIERRGDGPMRVPAEVSAQVQERLGSQQRMMFRFEIERVVEIGGGS